MGFVGILLQYTQNHILSTKGGLYLVYFVAVYIIYPYCDNLV